MSLGARNMGPPKRRPDSPLLGTPGGNHTLSPHPLMSFQRRCYRDSYGSRQSPRGGDRSLGAWESQPGLQAQLAHFLPSDMSQSWSSGSLCGLGPGWDEVASMPREH